MRGFKADSAAEYDAICSAIDSAIFSAVPHRRRDFEVLKFY